jgi:glycosyltransferase involved in cell wall biosynthesis
VKGVDGTKPASALSPTVGHGTSIEPFSAREDITVRIGVMLRTMDERQGTGVYTRNLMDHLLPLDKENEYVLFYSNPACLGRYAHLPQVTERVIRLPHKAIWDQILIPLAARRERLDVVFHPKFTVPFFTRRKTVMTIHGASWFVHPELYPRLGILYIRLAMPLYCRRADAILSNSSLTTRDFVRILKVPEEKITTVPLGTARCFRRIDDPAALAAVQQKHALPAKFILAVIRYDPRKNFKNLIAAFRELRRRIPAKLVVTGIGCEKYAEEYDLASDGTDKDVTFLGWIDHETLPALYNLAHCLFFPSVYEEFGIPACEAMACGCPPVVSTTGALPGIVGEAGLTADPFNPPALADALERIYTDEDLHAQLVLRSLERASEFTWDRCARETLNVLKKAGPS